MASKGGKQTLCEQTASDISSGWISQVNIMNQEKEHCRDKEGVWELGNLSSRFIFKWNEQN